MSKINYIARYYAIIHNKQAITGTKYDTLTSEVIINSDDFRQCYNKANKARKMLPKYWFLSKEGFLISVKGKKPKWIKPNLKSGRPQFKVWYNGKAISITTYDLVALVWDSYISKDAYILIEKYGLKALGASKITNGKHSPKVQGHHTRKEGYLSEKTYSNYVKNNDPTKIQLLTNREHIILHSLTGSWDKDKNKFYMPKFTNVPNKFIQIYTAGDDVKMIDPHNIIISQITNAYIDFREEDSVKTKEYIFVSKDNRLFMENNLSMLLQIAKLLENDNTNIRFNSFDYKDEIIYFAKL